MKINSLKIKEKIYAFQTRHKKRDFRDHGKPFLHLEKGKKNSHQNGDPIRYLSYTIPMRENDSW